MDVQLKLITTHNFTAKLIHLGMWLWAALRGLPQIKCRNHLQVYFGGYTSGALSHGVKTMKWGDYLATLGRHEIESVSIDLNEEQLVNGLEYINRSEGTKYEYLIFLWHPIKIFTGKWCGDRTEKRLACIEHGIRFLNATGKYNIDTEMNNYEFQIWVKENLDG